MQMDVGVRVRVRIGATHKKLEENEKDAGVHCASVSILQSCILKLTRQLSTITDALSNFDKVSIFLLVFLSNISS